MREIVPSRSNNDILLVLQYYDSDVDRATQAFLEGTVVFIPPKLFDAHCPLVLGDRLDFPCRCSYRTFVTKLRTFPNMESKV